MVRLLMMAALLLAGSAFAVRDQAQANERLKGIAVRTDTTSPAEPGAKRKATKLELAAGQIRW